MSLQAQGAVNRLSSHLEAEVVRLIDRMAGDTWEEGDIEARVEAVLFDQEASTLVIAYSSRRLNSGEKFLAQDPILIPGVSSVDEIIQKTRSGYSSLRDDIANAIGGSIKL